MRKIVGISQKIKRAWLDAVLDQLVQTTDEKELRAFLDQHLRRKSFLARSRGPRPLASSFASGAVFLQSV